MNWENKDKDPWGGKNNAGDFDDLLKKFASVMGAKKEGSSNGSNPSGGGFNMSSGRMFLYAFFAFTIVYASQCIYQLDASERANRRVKF
jgi:hypothetical protein